MRVNCEEMKMFRGLRFGYNSFIWGQISQARVTHVSECPLIPQMTIFVFVCQLELQTRVLFFMGVELWTKLTFLR